MEEFKNVKVILNNVNIAFPVPPETEKFLIQWDFKKPQEENIQNAIRMDSRIEESIRKFNLLYGGHFMEIDFTPKTNCLGFERYTLTIGKPIYETKGDE